VCIRRYLFDLGSHVSFRVNEQRVAIVMLENLRVRFRGNIPSFASRPQKTRQESLWPRVSYERCTPQHVPGHDKKRQTLAAPRRQTFVSVRAM